MKTESRWHRIESLHQSSCLKPTLPLDCSDMSQYIPICLHQILIWIKLDFNFFFKKYLFIYLFWLHRVLVAAHRIFSCGMQDLFSCSMQAS